MFKHGNKDENDPILVDRSTTNLLASRQKVQFKDEAPSYNNNNSNVKSYSELARVQHLSYSQNSINTVANQNSQSKV